jgi:hypothetical protein
MSLFLLVQPGFFEDLVEVGKQARRFGLALGAVLVVWHREDGKQEVDDRRGVGRDLLLSWEGRQDV